MENENKTNTNSSTNPEPKYFKVQTNRVNRARYSRNSSHKPAESKPDFNNQLIEKNKQLLFNEKPDSKISIEQQPISVNDPSSSFQPVVAPKPTPKHAVSRTDKSTRAKTNKDTESKKSTPKVIGSKPKPKKSTPKPVVAKPKPQLRSTESNKSKSSLKDDSKNINTKKPAQVPGVATAAAAGSAAASIKADPSKTQTMDPFAPKPESDYTSNPQPSFAQPDVVSNANASGDIGNSTAAMSDSAGSSYSQKKYSSGTINSKPASRKKPKARKSSAGPIVTLIIAVALIFGLAWVLREYVFQAYEIPSGSMEETISTGDMVFAEKLSHLVSSPQRGDIITFNDPEVDGRVLIKRCIATAGQTVDIKNNKFYVDGVELDEPYTLGKPTRTLNRSKVTYPYTIPEGHVWVMGDNRTNSQDSRYYGAIPTSSVIGKALFVYWPTSNAKLLL